jgi:hypothetical protein
MYVWPLAGAGSTPHRNGRGLLLLLNWIQSSPPAPPLFTMTRGLSGELVNSLGLLAPPDVRLDWHPHLNILRPFLWFFLSSQHHTTLLPEANNAIGLLFFYIFSWLLAPDRNTNKTHTHTERKLHPKGVKFWPAALAARYIQYINRRI